jgi:hypothetical protein
MNKKHLTEQDLIEFQFKLASDEKSAEIAGHLNSCNQCRELLEKLKRKFSALDLLRDEIKVSDDLKQQVIQQAKKPARSKIFSIYKPFWVGIAAVFVVGIVLFMSQPVGEQKQESAKSFESMPTSGPGGLNKSTDLSSANDERSTLSDSRTDSTGQVVTQAIPQPQDDGALMPTFSAAANSTQEIREVASSPPARGGMGGGGRGGAGAGRGALAPGTAQPVGGSALSATATSVPLQPVIVPESIAEVAEQPPFAPASAIELVVLPKRDSTQLTIYNSADLTLVRDRRSLTLKRGWNWLQFMWENTLIDPTSLSLEPTEQKGQIDVQQLVFPARLKNIGRWLIHSDIDGKVSFEITYLTSGLSWRAFYMGTFVEDQKSMRMQGYVRVTNNSGEDYENAQTRLIVGQVHILDQIAELAQRQYPYGRPDEGVALLGDKENLKDENETRLYYKRGEIKEDVLSLADTYKPKEIIKEGLSEYFLYTIEGTETIENTWSKRLISFDVNNIKVDSLYKYDEGRWGNETIRFVKFANDPNHNLGQTPIPDGEVKIYGIADRQGYLSYIGGTSIKYIPVNEEVELNLGQGRLVEVKPSLMDYKTQNYMFDPNGRITGWDEVRTWKIEVTNADKIPVQIEITRDFGTEFWTFQCTTPYEKYDVTRVRFNLNIQPGKKQQFEYTVTTYKGRREDAYAKIQSERGQQ